MRILLIALLSTLSAITALSQAPPIEPGVSQELAKWRAARYSDVRYKLNLNLEKMSPVLKGTMEIRLKVSGGVEETRSGGGQAETRAAGSVPPIILDWRLIAGHEKASTISRVSVNGQVAASVWCKLTRITGQARGGTLTKSPLCGPEPDDSLSYLDSKDHIVFEDGVVMGENVIKLDFTSPILASGSAITRYVDKEDGSEYIYSLFVPSDASTAFPVFDQPDLKATFELNMRVPPSWKPVSNTGLRALPIASRCFNPGGECLTSYFFEVTQPISSYVFAFAAGPWERFDPPGWRPRVSESDSLESNRITIESMRADAKGSDKSIYVRKSQAAKFKPHAAEVFRLNREAIKYFEQYFDYKFPFPKYDLVLIPEFPFGGMEHAGATFLRESSIIFPQEPTKNDLVSRATLIFHEAAHQWFGDTVTMRWFDDLWLKEGFATFTAYKAMEKIMPEMNSWKVFYERIKQGAYQTDSTKGTTPIYQEIKNLSAAKSAYGNIVYNKAPAFLRQAEFYLGEDKFQTAVRAFLKKHEFGNATWEDLVTEFENFGIRKLDSATGMSRKDIDDHVKKERLLIRYWSKFWVSSPGVSKIRIKVEGDTLPDMYENFAFTQEKAQNDFWTHYQSVGLAMRFKYLAGVGNGITLLEDAEIDLTGRSREMISGDGPATANLPVKFIFPNYGDYGYGIFLLDEKSREYVLKNIQNEKDPFLRSMMWGSLWDSVREGELDPREYVELVVKVQSSNFSLPPSQKEQAKACTLNCEDESTVASLLGRVGTAMNYYMSVPPAGSTAGRSDTSPPANAGGSDKGLQTRLENLLIDRMRNADTAGQRITFYRAFLNVAQSENARKVLKEMLGATASTTPSAKPATPPIQEGSLKEATTPAAKPATPPIQEGSLKSIPLKTKDKFDIVTRLLILNDPDASKLLADLEKAETTDDAKRYAYAAKAGIPTAENKAKYWNDFTSNKEISESWIEAAFGPWNSIRHADLTLPYLQKALQELPNHKRNRKIFFVNGWLGAFIGGQRSEEALNIVNKFLTDNPNLDRDLRLKILENVDVIERAVKIRNKFKN
jgi:aminopeptidase N